MVKFMKMIKKEKKHGDVHGEKRKRQGDEDPL